MPGASRVLVVDDSPTIRRVVGSVLQRAGHEVATADDGDRVVDEVISFEPDLLLLDLTLPSLDGLQALQRLDEALGDRGPPVVLMATRDDEMRSVDESLKTLGVVDVITKPFSPEALLAVAHHCLEKHGRRARPAEATRVVLAMASIAVADSKRSDAGAPSDKATQSSGAHAFSDDEFTMPALRARNTTEQGTQIQSTQHGAPVVARAATIALPEGYALVGELSAIGLPEVLQLLKFQGQSGLLVVENSELRFEVGLDDGAIVSVVARDTDEGPARRGELLLGRYFVTAGLIDADGLEAHIARQRAGDERPIGEQLVAAGAITRDGLRSAVAEQAQDFLVELLRSRRGVFGLKAGPAHVPKMAVKPGWSIDALMFEALRRIDEWIVIESEVPSFDSRFVAAGDEHQGAAVRGVVDDSGLTAEERTVLEMLRQGTARVRDLVKRSPLLPFDVCRMLYRLAVLKRVTRVDDGDPQRLLGDNASPREPVLSTPPRRADEQ